MERIILYVKLIISSFRGLFKLLFGRYIPMTFPPRKDLNGLTIVVTGANSGLGKSMTETLASQGASVYLACRSEQRAEQAIKDILTRVPGAKLSFVALDTGSLDSVRQFAQAWKSNSRPPINVLIHNAGITGTIEPQPTADRLPKTYQVNFLSPFLMTYLLEDSLTPKARVILTSSLASYAAHVADDFSVEAVYDGFERGFHLAKHGPVSDEVVYGNTKLMQCAFARLLQARFNSKTPGRRAFSFSPGLSATPILNPGNIPSFFENPAECLRSYVKTWAMPVEKGAATGVLLASTDDPKILSQGGTYWDWCRIEVNPADLMSSAKLQRLWLRWCADAGIEWI